MPQQQLYSVVFSGELAVGASAEQVRADIGRRFRMAPEQVARLFGGRPLVLGRDLPLARAEALEAAFLAVGARCRIRLQPPAPAPLSAAEVSPTPAAAAEPAFLGALEPIAAARATRWARRLLAGAALLLPALYPALIAGLAAIALVLGLRLAHQWPGLWPALLTGVLPALAAVAALAWLLRPLLGRDPPPLALPLDPRQAPALHALAADIAARLGVPAPDRLLVDDSTELRAEWWLSPRRPRLCLRLRVGLPLLATPDQRQLAGQLAEALASSAPAEAPLALRWLEASAAGLRRRAGRRGALDEMLAQAARRRPGWPARTLAVAAALLGLPHRLLARLALITGSLAGRLSRRRELAGWRQHLNLVGGAAAAASLRQRRRMQRIQQSLHEELAQGEVALLCEDLPGLLAWLAERPASAQPSADEARQDELLPRGVSDVERLREAAAAPAGEPIGGAPARVLLEDYAGVARELSLERCRRLGLRVEPAALASLARACDALMARKRMAAALSDYFCGYRLSEHAIVPLGMAEARALAPAARVAALEEAVARVRRIVPELLRLRDDYPAAVARLRAADLALSLDRKLRRPADEASLRDRREAFDRHEAERLRYGELLARRLGLGLAEAVHRSTDKTRLAVELKIAIAALVELGNLATELNASRRQIALACALLEARERGARLANQALLLEMNSAWQWLERLDSRLEGIRTADGPIADEVRRVLPPLPPRARAPALQSHLDRLESVLERIRRRLAGRLAQLAAAAEAAHGIRIKLIDGAPGVRSCSDAGL